MPSSLEELLAKDGFSRGKSGMKSRASFRAEAANRTRERKTDSPLGPSISRIKNERTKSDVGRHVLKAELSKHDSGSSRRPRDDLVRRDKIDGRSKVENWECTGGQDSDEGWEGKEIVEVGLEEDEKFKDIYSDRAYKSGRSEKSSSGNRNSDRNLLKHTLLAETNRKSMKKPDVYYEGSLRGSRNDKAFKNVRTNAPPVPKIALDEVAVQALISILNGYTKRFLDNEEFRAEVRENSLSSFNFEEIAEADSIQIKVRTNLEQAIGTVEKAAEDKGASIKDLKKASLQLRVITGLKSNDQIEEYASGIPSRKLSACSHLYLSVICKLQKKDRSSAKHLLQVFFDSPFWARTVLLPELWDNLFFPHLSHLKEWYKQEAASLPSTPSKIRKLKLLDKVYSEILDSGTYQFAVYYKDWLTEGVESPSVPSIHIPSLSVQDVQRGSSEDHTLEQGGQISTFSPQPMVSKKLYDALIGHSSKPGVYESEDDVTTNSFDKGTNSPDGSASDFKQALSDSSEMVKYPVQEMEFHSLENRGDNIFDSDSKEDWKLVKVSTSPDVDFANALHQESTGDSQFLDASLDTKANEVTLKNLAKSVFELQQTKDSIDLPLIPNSVMPFRRRNSNEDLNTYFEYFDDEFLFASIPQDFICPLTGKLFDDPVTLETGQTFEREAILEWFNQGKRTCPVTGKALENIVVPVTNFILKRIIRSWKSQYCSQLLGFASQVVRDSGVEESRQRDETALLVLEMLLTSFSGEERLTYAKHLISLGGIEFLIRMFEYGNLEEKTRVAALLCTCIEADTVCRGQIAGRIDKELLLELLRSKQRNSRRYAVLLLIEIVCLSRRKDVAMFLNGLWSEEILNAMHILLVYLRSCPPEQKPLVSVLLLKLDLMVEPQKYSIYREEAVDAISMALECSLTDDKVREESCRALLILGGSLSSSGELLTEKWILKQAGFSIDSPINSQDDGLSLGSPEDGEQPGEEWLRNLSASLLGSGKKSFLEAISKCLSSGNLDLVGVCLTTVVRLSYALSFPSDANAEFQLSAFSVLIPVLKESLENGKCIEHRVLASMSLLNLSKIPECRVLLMAIAKEIAIPLRSLGEVTWTAKELYTKVFVDDF